MGDKTPRTWPVNCWYVGARSEEVGEKPLGRQICGEGMVFFRDAEGVAHALENFCPHRGAPLSLGFVENGKLVCGYHGLTVACSGKVAHMPGQRVENFPAVRAFPIVEYGGYLWVWPGDAHKAAPDSIPRMEWIDNPDEWRYSNGIFHIKADYRLLVDNLMDLTHETYVHRDSIGQKEIDEAPVETSVEDGEVFTRRFMPDIPPPPFFRMALAQSGLPADRNVDRWQICRFTLPSHVTLDVGVALVGHGGHGADPSVRVGAYVFDFITPESENTLWYFYGFARNFAIGNDALTDTIRDNQARIFTEDLEMLEQQQLNLARYGDKRLLKLNIDAGGVRSRMLIDRAIKAEDPEDRPKALASA